ncbi:hypothetical protein [Rudaeicoccus suwonensis]|uniref:Uncharacterized protein n=1 Tax=Rudaeicoccus suwonensis TaxID=657409 RepID=A0A561E3Z1_9MICO|nr:hypothetical protein [Rudaeicoccus suwonensis]TWE10301.1 hypothetical protein BKA23_2657 [Rudaeicoccus suwonensis]
MSTEQQALPIYAVAQRDGSKVTIDLTSRGAFNDFEFTAHRNGINAYFSAYHTGEAAIFAHVLNRYLADISCEQRVASIAEVRTELARITVGRTATERGEDCFGPLLINVLERRVEFAALTQARYPTSNCDGSAIVVTPTTYGLDVTLSKLDAAAHFTFSWPTKNLWQLLAGMAWRSYARPNYKFSQFSRIPTVECQKALNIAHGVAENGGGANPLNA